MNRRCQYYGGGGYNPLTNNTMSYSPYFCRNMFTSGQADRMRLAFASYSLLQGVAVVSKLTSIDNLCHSNGKTLTIRNLYNHTAIWQGSNNVSIVSSTNTSVTVRVRSSSSSGQGWVKATLSNGVQLTETFAVKEVFKCE